MVLVPTTFCPRRDETRSPVWRLHCPVHSKGRGCEDEGERRGFLKGDIRRDLHHHREQLKG